MGTKNAQGKPHGAYVLCRSKFLELQTKYLNFVCLKYSSFTNKDIFAEMHLTCEIFGGWYSDKNLAIFWRAYFNPQVNTRQEQPNTFRWKLILSRVKILGSSLSMHFFLTCSSVNVYSVSCFSYLAFVTVYQLAHKNKTVGIEFD